MESGKMRKLRQLWTNYSSYVLLTVVLPLSLLSLSSCVFLNAGRPNANDVQISLFVSEYNSGPSVEDAIVEVIKNGSVIDKKKTNSGLARFEVPRYSGPYLIRISKDGYATTTIKVLNIHSPLVLNTTLRRPKFLVGEQNTNEIDISFDIYTSDRKLSKLLPDENGVYSIFGLPKLYISAQSTVSRLPIAFMYAKLGNPPGAEYLSSPRLFAESDVLEGYLELTPFSGKTYLFIDAYDVNDNRYEIVVPLNIIKSTDLKIVPYIVEAQQPSVYAYHLNTTVKYYSTEIGESYDSKEKLTNLYVKLVWKKWSDSTQRSRTNEPDGYVIYKSYDGQKYERLSVVGSKQNAYYDTYNNLPDVRVWYSISAKYGDLEGPKTFLGSVVPLPMVYITDVSPTDGATNVSLTPTFSWKMAGVDKYVGKVKYLYDIWLYDLTVNSGQFHYPLIEDTYFVSESSHVSIALSSYSWYKLPDGKLQSGKPYEWAPELIAAMWEDRENNSVSLSVNCDYNFKVAPMVIAPEKYYLFVTGSE
ncbi:hypothetical protein CBS1_04295 [Fervidobacterium changbaicum]|nr:hypothetical protein CBS1_04295 [Fervidobacterium changbaicum]